MGTVLYGKTTYIKRFYMNFYVIRGKNIILEKSRNLLNDEDMLKIKDGIEDSYEDVVFDIRMIRLREDYLLPDGFSEVMLREYYAGNEESEGILAFRAKVLLEWRSSTRYCCACGTVLSNHPSMTALQCPGCGKIFFPRISPCIIVVIHKNDKILLVRHTYRNQDMYACVAGFMEAGETAENAVRREVLEETGLCVKNIVYRGSQSWPFPDQLMLGFTADWESGELNLQEDEIADAQWFDPENCPSSPKPGSIAYRLIHGLY